MTETDTDLVKGLRLSRGNRGAALAQSLHVPHWWLSEQPLVLPAELRGVLVADAIPRTPGIQVLTEEQAPGLLEPEVLLELQGAQRGYRLEVMVKGGHAHPQVPGEAL